jgi:hypothetical protein
VGTTGSAKADTTGGESGTTGGGETVATRDGNVVCGGSAGCGPMACEGVAAHSIICECLEGCADVNTSIGDGVNRIPWPKGINTHREGRLTSNGAGGSMGGGARPPAGGTRYSMGDEVGHSTGGGARCSSGGRVGCSSVGGAGH